MKGVQEKTSKNTARRGNRSLQGLVPVSSKLMEQKENDQR